MKTSGQAEKEAQFVALVHEIKKEVDKLKKEVKTLKAKRG